jgi:hypothetical protein
LAYLSEFSASTDGRFSRVCANPQVPKSEWFYQKRQWIKTVPAELGDSRIVDVFIWNSIYQLNPTFPKFVICKFPKP